KDRRIDYWKQRFNNCENGRRILTIEIQTLQNDIQKLQNENQRLCAERDILRNRIENTHDENQGLHTEMRALRNQNQTLRTNNLDMFIALWRGYLNTIGVNPYDKAGGPPCGWERSMGILRSCMSGEAAEWFDREITGKNWELAFINSNGRAATANALSGMTV